MVGAREHLVADGVAVGRRRVGLLLGSRLFRSWLLGSGGLGGSWFLSGSRLRSRLLGRSGLRGSWLLSSRQLNVSGLGGLRQVGLAAGGGVLVDQVLLDGLVDLAVSL